MYITPNKPPTPIQYECRRLFLPRYLPMRDKVFGVLTDALVTSRWVELGTMTADEATNIMRTVYMSTWKPCSTIGQIGEFAVNAAPDGWLPCDGSQHDRVDYPDLYNAIHSSLIVDADTFRTPNLIDRFTVGTGNLYGLGDTGGENMVQLLEGQMPSHSHTYNVPVSQVTPIGELPAQTTRGIGVSPATSGIAGGNQSHENRPPYYAVQKFIYTGVHNA